MKRKLLFRLAAACAILLGACEFFIDSPGNSTPAYIQGTLSYTITYPEGAAAMVTLHRLPALHNVALNPGSLPHDNGIRETRNVEAGAYLLSVYIRKGDLFAGISETVEIITFETTEFSKNFNDADLLNSLPHTFVETFEYADINALHFLWSASGSVAITVQEAESPADPWFGNETRFAKLPAVTTYGGGLTVLERRVNPLAVSALTFSFKTEVHSPFGQNFRVFIDGIEKGSWDGYLFPWRTESILLNPGAQTIRFEVSSLGTFGAGRLNAVYIDNISLVPDLTDSVALHPRGALNAYVGAPDNEKIRFSAQALRADGSLRADSSLPANASGFAFSGPGVNPATGVFTPTAAGTAEITVSHGGKSASGLVTVHPADYMRAPYYYPGTGITYQGYSGTEGVRTTWGGVSITYPNELEFEADAFFTLEGSVNRPEVFNYAFVSVEKNGAAENLRTTYLVRGNFSQRIWLRLGPGDYTVEVNGMSEINLASEHGAEGDYYWSLIYRPGIIFNVRNTRNEGPSVDPSIPDRRFIYPSYLSQSDDFRISNLAASLTYGLTDNTAKLKAIHDFIVMNTVYDMGSIDIETRRKQDALTVVGARYHFDPQYNPGGHFLAVCEGYANAFTALARAAGFETRYVSSPGMAHGWNHVFVNGAWKFVDATWNDPTPSGASGIVDLGPGFVRYTYFLLDNLFGVNASHNGWSVNNRRSLVDIQAAPWVRGAPEGWY